MKYLTLEQAARLINPNYKLRSIFGAMDSHIRNGNFKQHFPQMAIVDADGNVLQQVGKSEKPFFLKSEIEDYVYNKKKLNMKNGNQKQVQVVGNGIDKTFKSINAAAKALDIDYFKMYYAINSGKELNGYKFSKV